MSSSLWWVRRQLGDPCVAAAHRLGYRSRAAFKLLELDSRLHLLRPGHLVIDFGAAPGGWTQVAVALVEAGRRPAGGRVVAVDNSPWLPVSGAVCLTHDLMSVDGLEYIRRALNNRRANVVLSDMSPNISGHQQTDYYRTITLVEAAYAFALDVLTFNGAFVAKIFHGGSEERTLFTDMKRHFISVHYVKPAASRQESSEIYLAAQGFAG